LGSFVWNTVNKTRLVAKKVFRGAENYKVIQHKQPSQTPDDETLWAVYGCSESCGSYMKQMTKCLLQWSQY